MPEKTNRPGFIGSYRSVYWQSCWLNCWCKRVWLGQKSTDIQSTSCWYAVHWPVIAISSNW